MPVAIFVPVCSATSRSTDGCTFVDLGQYYGRSVDRLLTCDDARREVPLLVQKAGHNAGKFHSWRSKTMRETLEKILVFYQSLVSSGFGECINLTNTRCHADIAGNLGMCRHRVPAHIRYRYDSHLFPYCSPKNLRASAGAASVMVLTLVWTGRLRITTLLMSSSISWISRSVRGTKCV